MGKKRRRGPRVLHYGDELWQKLAEPDPEDAEVEDLDPDLAFPRTRAECVNGLRPCPFVRCVHHTYLRVAPNGSIWVGHPEVMPWEMKDSCELDILDEMAEEDQDIARDRDGLTLKRVGQVFGMTRERTRQIEQDALRFLLEGFRERGLTWEDLSPGDGPEEQWPLASGDDQ